MKNSSIWDSYMKSYDTLLLSLHTYKELMDDMYRHSLNQVKQIKKKTVHILEAGCGTGNLLAAIDKIKADLPDKNIFLTGIDRSGFALQEASGKMKYRAKFFTCDLGKKELGMSRIHYVNFSEQKYDLVIVNNVLFALPLGEKRQFINQIRQIMSEDGALIISEPHNKASLFNILRAELAHSGKQGVLFKLLRRRISWALIKTVFINALFFTNVHFSSVKQSEFFCKAGFKLVTSQSHAYGGNNTIVVYKKRNE